MERKSNYRIERITAVHYLGMARLFEASGQKKIDFYKKYDCKHLKKTVLGVAIYENSNTPVAYIAQLPYLLSYEGKKFLAAQSCDTVTNPEYFRKGLSSQLFEYCTSIGIKEKMSGFFGIANKSSSGVVSKLNWTVLEPFKRYEISIKTLPIWSIFNRLGLGQFYTKSAMYFLKKHLVKPVLFNSFSHEEYLIVDRNKEHMEYKLNFGSIFLKVEEVTFWVKINYGQLCIGDIKTDSEIELLSAMDKICQICRKLGLRKIVFQTQTGSNLQQYFDNNYDAKVSSTIFYKDLGSGIPWEKLKLTFADSDTF